MKALSDTRNGSVRVPLWGLVLAGGTSSRMGMDKGALTLHGAAPQATRAWRLLTLLCDRAYVSVRAGQRHRAPYTELPVLVDQKQPGGPAAGLLSAWTRFPDVAWLVLAVDLLDVTAPMLRRLREARDPTVLATAYRHEDGTPEPLCTIWEPHARAALKPRGEASASLRQVLERGPARLLAPAEPTRLRNFNAPTDFADREAPG